MKNRFQRTYEELKLTSEMSIDEKIAGFQRTYEVKHDHQMPFPSLQYGFQRTYEN